MTWLRCFWARGTRFRLPQNMEGVDTQLPMPRRVSVRHCLNAYRQALLRMWTSMHHSIWSLLFPYMFSLKAKTSADDGTLKKTFSATSLSGSSVFLFPFCLRCSLLQFCLCHSALHGGVSLSPRCVKTLGEINSLFCSAPCFWKETEVCALRSLRTVQKWG